MSRLGLDVQMSRSRGWQVSSQFDSSASRRQQQYPEESPTVPTTVKEFIEAYLSFSAGDVNNALSWDDIRKFEYYELLLPLLE